MREIGALLGRWSVGSNSAVTVAAAEDWRANRIANRKADDKTNDRPQFLSRFNVASRSAMFFLRRLIS
jgi:hypothetical protein